MGSTEPEQAPEHTPERQNDGSGAYYYVETESQKLSEFSFARTTLTIIALLLQLVVLCLPQGSLEYVTLAYPSLAFCYMIAVFAFVIASVWIIVMNATRYKFLKRIPVSRAPRGGFARRAFFGNELYIAFNALIAVFEITFLCFKYDGVGLAGMFVCVLALAAAVAARQVTHVALKNSTLIPAAADAPPDDAPEQA